MPDHARRRNDDAALLGLSHSQINVTGYRVDIAARDVAALQAAENGQGASAAAVISDRWRCFAYVPVQRIYRIVFQ